MVEEEDLDPNRAPRKGMPDMEARRGREVVDALRAAVRGGVLARAARCVKLKSRDEKKGLWKRMSEERWAQWW